MKKFIRILAAGICIQFIFCYNLSAQEKAAPMNTFVAKEWYKRNGIEPPASSGGHVTKKHHNNMVLSGGVDNRIYPSSNVQTENSIAVSRKNPSNLFVSTNGTITTVANIQQTWFFSTDGGTTWFGSESNPLTVGPFGSLGDPVTFFDSIGTAYYGTLGLSTGGILIVPTTNFGTTWGVAANADLTHGVMDDKEHATAGTGSYTGRLYAAWTDFITGQVVVATSIGNYLAWPLRTAFNTGSDLGQGVHLASGPDGTVYIAMANYTGGSLPESGIRFAKSTDGGVTWSTPNVAFTISGIRTTNGADAAYNNTRVNSFPSMACGTATGQVYITYANKSSGDANIYMRYSSNGGSGWGSAIQVNSDSPNTQQWMPSIAVDPVTGTVNISYFSMQDTNGTKAVRMLAYSTNNGAAWTRKKLSDTSFTPAALGSPYADGYMGDYYETAAYNGRTWACWSDNRTGTFQAYVDTVSTLSSSGSSSACSADTISVGCESVIGSNIGISDADATGLVQADVSGGTSPWLSLPGKYVWFKFKTDSAGWYTVTTDDGRDVLCADAELALVKFAGDSCNGAKTIVGVNENVKDVVPSFHYRNGLAAQITDSLSANKWYWVAVQLYSGTGASGEVEGEFPIAVYRNKIPKNDSLKYAITVSSLLSGLDTCCHFTSKEYCYNPPGGPATQNASNNVSVNSQDGPTQNDAITFVGGDGHQCNGLAGIAANPTQKDIWFSFIWDSTWNKNVWLSLYRSATACGASGGTNPTYGMAIYDSTSSGLVYKECSAGDGIRPTNMFGGTNDMGKCNTPNVPRINLNGILTNHSSTHKYVVRVWQTPGSNNTEDGSIVLAAEAGQNLTTHVGSADARNADDCADAVDIFPTIPATAHTTIDTTVRCLSTAGMLGNYALSMNTDASCHTKISEPPTFQANVESGMFNLPCTGTSFSLLNNTVHNQNSALYRFRVPVSDSVLLVPHVKVRFENIEYCGVNGAPADFFVLKDTGVCLNGYAVMVGTTSAAATGSSVTVEDQRCVELVPYLGILPPGPYYIAVQGEAGQLACYDVHLVITYEHAITGTPFNPSSTAATLPGKFTLNYIKPLPAKEMVEVSYSSPEEQNVTLMVTDVTGRTRYTSGLTANAGSNSAYLNVSGFSAGVYMLTIKNNTGVVFSRFVKVE